jgi:Domain of unknown function (DUF1772)
MEGHREREQLVQISKAKRITWTIVGALLLGAIGVAAAFSSLHDGLYFANVALAGVLLGKETTTFFVITPAARKLAVPGQVALQQALAAPFRNIGPPIFNLVLLTGVALAATADSPARYFALAGSVCILAMLVVVFKVSVPINIWTERQTVDVDPDEWDARRRRWDRFQVVRLLLDVVALTCFLLAVLTRG